MKTVFRLVPSLIQVVIVIVHLVDIYNQGIYLQVGVKHPSIDHYHLFLNEIVIINNAKQKVAHFIMENNKGKFVKTCL